jgi:hypothetical protein
VLRGKTRVRIEKVGGRPNPYRVNTPTTVIAVRGTLFDVIVTEKETQVFVHEGEVAVSNFASPKVVVILSPGEMTRVQLALPPQSPSHFRPGRNNDNFKPGPHGRGPNDGKRGDGGTDEQSPNQPGESDRQRQSDEDSQDINGPDAKQTGEGPGAPPSGKPGGQKGNGKKP